MTTTKPVEAKPAVSAASKATLPAVGAAEVPVEASIGTIKSAKEVFLRNNQSKKVLLALCVGLNVGDWEKESYASAKGKVAFKSDTKLLQMEVLRRAAFLSGPPRLPRPAQWLLVADLKTWLEKFPVTDPENVEFLKVQEFSLRQDI
jgi:hypothetical protein